MIHADPLSVVSSVRVRLHFFLYASDVMFRSAKDFMSTGDKPLGSRSVVYDVASLRKPAEDPKTHGVEDACAAKPYDL